MTAPVVLTDGEREARMAALSDLAVGVAEQVWTEDEPTLAEYELVERVLATDRLAAERAAHEAGWDMHGGPMWFDREEWGVITDALIQHRGHADQRKAVNSESTSDVRADMCASLIERLNRAALAATVPTPPESVAKE